MAEADIDTEATFSVNSIAYLTKIMSPTGAGRNAHFLIGESGATANKDGKEPVP